MSGKFISFEGSEGAGKTTILERLVPDLAENYDVLVTREPGGNKVSEAIREILQSNEYGNIDGLTEALLFAAARRQHLVETILPALVDGKIVLTDRYVDSSLAYQGYARNLGFQEIWNLNRMATQEVMPGLTIYFDLDPEIGLARINATRQDKIDRLDSEDLSFYEDVRNGYLEIAKKFPERIVVIDADQPLEKVYQDTYQTVIEFLS